MNRSRPRPQRAWSLPLLALLFAGLVACPAKTKNKGDGENTSLFSEFLIVHYDEDRTVLIDGQPRGETGELARELLYYREQQARTLQQINQLNADDPDHRPLPELTQVRMELVELSLGDVVDPSQRAQLLSMPTSSSLEADQVQALIAAGRGLLEQHAALGRFLSDLR